MLMKDVEFIWTDSCQFDRLRLYQRPLSKEEFVSQIAADSGYHFFDGEEIAPAPSKS
jgi:hypothetical protein